MNGKASLFNQSLNFKMQEKHVAKNIADLLNCAVKMKIY